MSVNIDMYYIDVFIPQLHSFLSVLVLDAPCLFISL